MAKLPGQLGARQLLSVICPPRKKSVDKTRELAAEEGRPAVISQRRRGPELDRNAGPTFNSLMPTPQPPATGSGELDASWNASRPGESDRQGDHLQGTSHGGG